MMEFADWVVRVRFPDRPWLILGKGPSIDRLGSLRMEEYNILSMNHVIQAVPHVEIAHFIDIEAFSACQLYVVAKAEWLIMPTRPHVNSTIGPPIKDHFDGNPGLELVEGERRLVTYIKEPRQPEYKSPYAIAVRYFSFEAALCILGELGVRDVKTLGVDGGTAYGTAFSSLTPLENGRKSFDIQFEAAREIAAYYKLSFERIK